jgi:hypothetical protein
MMKFFSPKFWNYALERAIKTIAQSAVAFLGVGSMGLFTIDWMGLVSMSLAAGLLSILTSVVNHKEG